MANQVHGIRLTALGYTQFRTASHAEFDLLDQAAVNRFFADQRIDQVYRGALRKNLASAGFLRFGVQLRREAKPWAERL